MRQIIVLVSVIQVFGFLGVFGCASKQQETTTPQSTDVDEVPDTSFDSVGSDDGPDYSEDQSTGDSVPEGPGEASPPSHVMAEDARGIYNDGVRAAKSSSLAEAEQSFKRTLQIDRHAHQAAYNLGVIAERKGDEAGAISYYKQAIDMQPDYVPALVAWANLDIRQGNINKAVELFRKKASSYPKNLELMNQYADVLNSAKQHKDAIAVAKQVLRTDERNAGAMLQIGKANLRLGRTELAESVFSQVLAINPDKAEIYFLRASIRMGQGQKQSAIDDYKMALEKQPTHVEAMNNLATMYLLSGNYETAIDLLQKAVTLSPSWAVLQLNLGNAFRGAGRWSDAKKALIESRNLDSKTQSAIFNLGLLYYVATDLDGLDRKARLKEAQEYFAKYKSELGSILKKDDQVHKYIKEIQTSIEREETRVQRQKEREEREAKRAKAREAEEAKKAAAAEAGDAEGEESEGGESEGGDGEDGDGGDDGWF